MQADFLVRQIVSSRQLDPVHPQVRAGKAGAVGIFGVNLRQGHKRPAVAGPACHLRQLIDRRRMLKNRPRIDHLRLHSPKRRRNLAIAPRPFQGESRINLEFDKSADMSQSVAEQESRARFRSEEIADHRKPAAADARIKDGRPPALIDAPLDFRRFEMGIDLVFDANQLSAPFQVADAFGEVSVAHLWVSTWRFGCGPRE